MKQIEGRGFVVGPVEKYDWRERERGRERGRGRGKTQTATQRGEAGHFFPTPLTTLQETPEVYDSWPPDPGSDTD